MRLKDKSLQEKNYNGARIMDSKVIYLAKTLSRTKRKDYENYVVNAIWNRINDSRLVPVSQQYVKSNNGI